MTNELHYLGFDVETASAKYTVRRLATLKTTDAVENMGAYGECPEYTKVFIDTTWTEAQLEEWLYRTSGVNAVGAFERTNCYKEDGYLWDQIEAIPIHKM